MTYSPNSPGMRMLGGFERDIWKQGDFTQAVRVPVAVDSEGQHIMIGDAGYLASLATRQVEVSVATTSIGDKVSDVRIEASMPEGFRRWPMLGTPRLVVTSQGLEAPRSLEENSLHRTRLPRASAVGVTIDFVLGAGAVFRRVGEEDVLVTRFNMDDIDQREPTAEGRRAAVAFEFATSLVQWAQAERPELGPPAPTALKPNEFAQAA